MQTIDIAISDEVKTSPQKIATVKTFMTNDCDQSGGEIDFDYCEICQSSFDNVENKKLALICGHVFCLDCITQYVNIGTNSSKRSAFNHLFCPFRCGSSIDTCKDLPPNLCEILSDEKNLIRKIGVIASETLKVDDQYPSNLTENSMELVMYALKFYSFYICSSCKNVFPLKALCVAANGDGNDSDAKDIYYCQSCTRKGGQKDLISIAKPRARDASLAIQSYLLDNHICDSDENALLQQTEVEVLMSMYGEELTVMTPPPSRAGDPCAYIHIRASKLSLLHNFHVAHTKEKQNDEKIASQLSFYFILPGSYPTRAKPVIKLNVGSLSLADFDFYMRGSLMARMVN